MKKLLSIVILFTFFNFSCKKLDHNSDQVNGDAISAVSNAKSREMMKNSYALLNSEEKLAMWSQHFDTFVSENELTEDQLNFISDFKQQWLQIELFDQKGDLFDNFTSQISSIKENAIKILGVDYAYTLLFDLNMEGKAAPPANDNDCHCSKTDSYCNVGSCEANGCKQSSWGCGTLWMFSCGGVCKFI